MAWGGVRIMHVNGAAGVLATDKLDSSNLLRTCPCIVLCLLNRFSQVLQIRSRINERQARLSGQQA